MIGERIDMLCKESRMKRKDVANATHITEAAFSRYVNNERQPRAAALIRIAEFFGVSVDWLLGLTDRRNYEWCVSCDDLLDYCEMAKKANMACRSAVVNRDYQKLKSAHDIAMDVEAEAFFEREILRWEFDIPKMIHDVASGEWKEMKE